MAKSGERGISPTVSILSTHVARRLAHSFPCLGFPCSTSPPHSCSFVVDRKSLFSRFFESNHMIPKEKNNRQKISHLEHNGQHKEPVRGLCRPNEQEAHRLGLAQPSIEAKDRVWTGEGTTSPGRPPSVTLHGGLGFGFPSASRPSRRSRQTPLFVFLINLCGPVPRPPGCVPEKKDFWLRDEQGPQPISQPSLQLRKLLAPRGHTPGGLR
jgi:hypothetical protein